MRMNPSFQSMKSTLALLIVGILATFSAEASTDIEHFRNRYLTARDEHERLQVAIDVIDKNLICLGCSVAAVDRIFDTTISDDGFSISGPFTMASVRFRESAFNGDVSIQAPMLGWYLVIRYDHQYVIVDYYLSNIGK